MLEGTFQYPGPPAGYVREVKPLPRPVRTAGRPLAVTLCSFTGQKLEIKNKTPKNPQNLNSQKIYTQLPPVGGSPCGWSQTGCGSER